MRDPATSEAQSRLQSDLQSNRDAQPPDPQQPEAIGTGRKLVFCSLLVLMLLALAEVTARVGYFVAEDFDPYYLRFGFVADTEFHSYEEDGYSKFHPGSVKRQKTATGVIEMQMNELGFRRTGAADPIPEGDDPTHDPTQSGALRVATLGASSTFGYYVEDDETYPARLESMLRASLPGRQVEVFNLGVPHLRLENIVALARRELPQVRPQIVTLYCGFNNIGQPNRQTAGQTVRFKDWLHFHSVLYRVVRPVLKTVYFSVVETSNRDLAGLEHLSLPITLSRQEIDQVRAEIAGDFRRYLEELHQVVEALGPPVPQLVLVTQNYNLKLRSGSGLQDRWRTYEEELRLVEDMLERDGSLTAVQSSLLIHRDLMDVQRRFARRHQLPLVEGIEAMAEDPSQMHSGVHLTATGNLRIAEALYAEILALADGANSRRP